MPDIPELASASLARSSMAVCVVHESDTQGYHECGLIINRQIHQGRPSDVCRDKHPTLPMAAVACVQHQAGARPTSLSQSDCLARRRPWLASIAGSARPAHTACTHGPIDNHLSMGKDGVQACHGSQVDDLAHICTVCHSQRTSDAPSHTI